jgi:hypothetical protein
MSFFDNTKKTQIVDWTLLEYNKIVLYFPSG